MKSKINCLTGLLCLIVALLATTGCSDENEYASDHSFYDDVKLKIDQVDAKNVLSVKLADETYPLSVGVTPGTLSFKPTSYTYEVGDNSIATVDREGKLTLLKPGETTLTVKYRTNKEISTDCTLKVIASLIRDVVVSSEVVIGMEEPVDLAEYITIMPWSADARALSYTVKQGYEGIVEMVEGSIVQGLGIGEAFIEVRSTDGLDVVKELKLVVKGSTPMTSMSLNETAAEINGQELLVAQEIDLASLVTILPENAADKRLKYDVLSGADYVSISEDGILTTTKGSDGAEVEIQISPLDKELNAGITPCTLRFTIKSWNERENWKVTTSVNYGGMNYVPDSGTGSGKPEDILDGQATTFLSMLKPGKSGTINGGSYTGGNDLSFTVDMGMPQAFNYFYWQHRTFGTPGFLQVLSIDIYGSNDNVSFTKINSDVISLTENEYGIQNFDIPKSTYRYVKVQYMSYSSGGSSAQVAEFNIGIKE